MREATYFFLEDGDGLNVMKALLKPATLACSLRLFVRLLDLQLREPLDPIIR